MTTVLHRTLRPILCLSKCIGLINITYRMEPTGLFVHNVLSLFHICFEITSFNVLLMFTFILIYPYGSKTRIIHVIVILKFWANIIAARLSNKWIIQWLFIIIIFYTLVIFVCGIKFIWIKIIYWKLLFSFKYGLKILKLIIIKFCLKQIQKIIYYNIII